MRINCFLKKKFIYGDGLSIDKEKFEKIFSLCVKSYPEIEKSLEAIDKMYLLLDVNEYNNVTYSFALETFGKEREWLFYERYPFISYSNEFGIRGINITNKGIIISNLNTIHKTSKTIYDDIQSYYKINDDDEEFKKTHKEKVFNWTKETTHYEDIENYAKSSDAIAQLLFWNNIFHEIRHTQQYIEDDLNMIQYDDYLYRKCPFSPEENDAVGFSKAIFKNIIEKEDYFVLKNTHVHDETDEYQELFNDKSA